MKHYIVVSLDIKTNNIIIIGFNIEKGADKSIEKLSVYGDRYYGCAWFSIDYYGKCEEQEVRSYYSNKNIVQLIDRKTPLNNRAIITINKTLLGAYKV